MSEEKPTVGSKIYNVVLKIAAVIMAAFFLYWQVAPFLDWFGNKK